jgi:chromate transporter
VDVNEYSTSSLRELAVIFGRLGATAFGGPLAHIALMEQEFVSKRGWFSREEFLDMISATNLIPGPNSTEMAMHIGHRRAGNGGLIVAGCGFYSSCRADDVAAGVVFTLVSVLHRSRRRFCTALARLSSRLWRRRCGNLARRQ